jgi:hypothetical protein
MNPMIQAWFDDRKAVEALLGEGEFFIGGTTYRATHDRLLVIRQLLLWAVEHDGWNQAAVALDEAIARLVEEQSVREAFDLVWCYLLVRRDMNEELPLVLSAVARVLNQLHIDPSLLAADQELASLIEAVNSALAAESVSSAERARG